MLATPRGLHPSATRRRTVPRLYYGVGFTTTGASTDVSSTRNLRTIARDPAPQAWSFKLTMVSLKLREAVIPS